MENECTLSMIISHWTVEWREQASLIGPEIHGLILKLEKLNWHLKLDLKKKLCLGLNKRPLKLPKTIFGLIPYEHK